MHARMTISIQDTIYEQFMQLVPAKKRSQYIEQLLAEAIHKKKLPQETQNVRRWPMTPTI